MGESEQEFAERLAKAIWKANKGFCPVEVRATYLEELPFTSYRFHTEGFKTLMGKRKKRRKSHV